MKIRTLLFSGAMLAGMSYASAPTADAQERYLGDIFIVGANFCPRGSASADGQILPISQNQALFSLLGTNYGGDGRSTFALPDLRSRFPVGEGQGPALSNRVLGTRGGTETQTLTTANLPNHSHQLNATSAGPTTGSPANGLMATFGPAISVYTTGAADETMKVGSISSTGANQAFSVMNPYQTVRFCIATQGLFPSRN